MENSILAIQRQQHLLRMEYEAEREEYLSYTRSMSVERKVRLGICWWNITIGRNYYNSLNQRVVEIFRSCHSENEGAEHLFEHGKPVRFFTIDRNNPKDKSKLLFLNYNCNVSFVDADMMVVSIPSAQALIDIQNAKQIGVQLYFDETSYQSMFHALNEVANARDNRLSYLRDVFSGQLPPLRYDFTPLRFPWLNPTQERAVNEVLRAKDVSIIHGPPGTGKTTTLVEAIYETLRRETQVLVCAQSNTAVDWISEKLVDHGIPVLRIGNPTRVNDKMLSFTYERRFEGHPDYPQLWSIRNAIRQIREKREKSESVRQKINRLRERADELEMVIRTSLFSEARVVACTLVGAANKILVGHKFSTIFIDEAAQALEAACWIGIRRANRVVLAGDHQQLPPTIKNYDAARQGLAFTLMERIVHNQPDVVTLLKVQYRMNDAISQFSSHWFYDGLVESAPEVAGRSILDFDNPVMWVDTSNTDVRVKYQMSKKVGEIDDRLELEETDFSEQYVGENFGRINKPEAEITICVLQEYIEKIGRQRFLDERFDVGVISPYKVQARYLQTQIKKNQYFKPFRNLITVNTVDGFQGQERDIMFISLVRSNEQGQIGFLSDLRRMNVAITRARMKLVIIGDVQTLTCHSFYRQLYKYITSLDR